MKIRLNNYNGDFETVALDDDVLTVMEELDVGDGVFVECCYDFSNDFAYLGGEKLYELYDEYMDFGDCYSFDVYLYCYVNDISPYDTMWFSTWIELEDYFLELAEEAICQWNLPSKIEGYIDNERYARDLRLESKIHSVDDGWLLIF